MILEMEADAKHLDSLRAELAACDLWDLMFYRSTNKDPADCIAFASRQIRRRTLTSMISALSHEGGFSETDSEGDRC
jgi:hypothetical protein